MIVKVDVIINEPSCIGKCFDLRSVNTLCFRIEKKFSAKALSYGFPRLDIDGVKGFTSTKKIMNIAETVFP